MKKAIILFVLVFVILSGCSGEREIVGSWKDQQVGMITYDFYEDGKVKLTALVAEQNGTYKVKGDRLELNLNGKTIEVDFKIKDDVLTMNNKGEIVSFTKMKEL